MMVIDHLFKLFRHPHRLEHWQRLFSGTSDEAHVASVSRIATTHARIGLRPSFYISTYLIALEQVHTLLIETDRHRLHELADPFDAILGGFTQDIGNAADPLNDGSVALLDAAGSATREATALTRGADESSLNMQPWPPRPRRSAPPSVKSRARPAARRR